MGMLYRLLNATKNLSSRQSKVSVLMDILSEERHNKNIKDNLEVFGCHFKGDRSPYLNFEAATEKIDFYAITSLMKSLNKKGFNTKIEIMRADGVTFYDIRDSSERRLFMMQVYQNKEENPEIVSLEISCDLATVLNRSEFYILEKALG